MTRLTQVYYEIEHHHHYQQKQQQQQQQLAVTSDVPAAQDALVMSGWLCN